MTEQPIWRCIANLGDVNPLDHGGVFVLIDKTGVYPPEMEVWEAPDGDVEHWERARFIMDPCTYRDGVLSDNPYHPELPAWWAADGWLASCANTNGVTGLELINQLCSDDPVERAQGYYSLYLCHGGQEITAGEVEVWKSRGQVGTVMRNYLRQMKKAT